MWEKLKPVAMKKLFINKSVTLSGRNFWGQRSSITFEPSLEEGWHWKIFDREIGKFCHFPIIPGLVAHSNQNLYLKYHDQKLHVYEHIGPLRFTGITGVVISSSASWPPYLTTGEMFEALQKENALTESSDEIEFFSLANASWSYKDRCGSTSTFRHPSSEKQGIIAEVIIDYPGIGRHEKSYFTQDEKVLHSAFIAGPQGYPKERYVASKIANLFGWPHHERVVWPQIYGRKEALKLFSEHRFVDILGALSILDNKMLPSGKVVSHCSGHLADYEIIKSHISSIVSLV